LCAVILSCFLAVTVSQYNLGSCDLTNSNDYCLIAEGVANKIATFLHGRQPCTFAARLYNITNDDDHFTTQALVDILVVELNRDFTVVLSTDSSVAVGSGLLEDLRLDLATNVSEFKHQIWRNAKHGGGLFTVLSSSGLSQGYSTGAFSDSDRRREFVVAVYYNSDNCCACTDVSFPHTYDEVLRDALEAKAELPDTQINLYFADILNGA